MANGKRSGRYYITENTAKPGGAPGRKGSGVPPGKEQGKLMRILLIEDDLKTAEFVAKGLAQSGFRTCHATDGLDGLFKARAESFDLAIIDIMLPKLDGFSVIEEIRAARLTLPIIVLSARDSVESKIKGLEKGGDDYLSKPFSFAELLARVQALLRRASSAAEPTTLVVGDLTLDLIARKVTRAGQAVDLQPLEFQLLEYLMRNHGRVVSKTTILEHVWEYNFDTQSNIVEAGIFRLREKVDKPFETKMIHTVRGFGYVLE
ncbi:Transcriptional activator protein CopR [bioreactor metagenome]|uniref:Transcriptional activator protein CopR n=1 Tax=bioreactor metagenome TaxID=1076179 RepID=A0A644Z745_9ZZZZ